MRYLRIPFLPVAMAALLVALLAAVSPANEPAKEFEARHVLISFAGAPRTQATRTKEEAKALADELYAKISKDPKTFAATAMASSDCTSAPEGGYLGKFGPGGMVKEFEDAVQNSEAGTITEPVETMFGYHIIQRLSGEKRPLGIVVVPFGETASNIGITRNREEAEARANEALAAIAAGKSFAEVAKQYSDAPSASLGGYAGRLAPGAPFPPAVLDASYGAEAGKATELLSNDRAFFIGYRFSDEEAAGIDARLNERVGLRALFLRYVGALGADASETRTLDEARELAKQVKDRVEAGEAFGDFVVQFGTSQAEKDRRGELGTAPRRALNPRLQEVVFGLEVGKVGILEMEEGVLVVQRAEVAEPAAAKPAPTAAAPAEEAAPAEAPAAP